MRAKRGRLIAVDGRRIVFDARQPGPFVVRVRSSAAWQVESGNACTGAGRDDWLAVDVATAGRIVLTQRVNWLTLLQDDADRSCHEVTDSRPSWTPARFSASID